MKPRSSISRRSRRAAALIIVLASLIFLAALTLAFLASVNTELRSSKVYSAGSNAKLLAQTAVNLATAQISAATKGLDASSNTLAWASQPGMIRTYNTSGDPAGYYRLYSWTDMTGSGGFDYALATNTVSTSWSSMPAVFVDLNQPMRVPSGGSNLSVYPIIDGNNLTPMAAVNGNKTYGSNNIPAIDGFYVSTTAPVAVGGTANPVPMPVKWLYVLENGKIVAPDPSGTGAAAVVSGASATNQIIGRVAFWADDETCKLNINTASEGTYEDMPRFNSDYDTKTLSAKQPVQNEYQRYPGHPATTSLSTVIKKPADWSGTDEDWTEEIYKIIPRVKEGGSKGATVTTTGNAVGTGLQPDADRLFAGVDELVFQPGLSGAQRTDNNSSSLNKDTLRQAKFFLTTSSRAPDVNLFNKPRVGIWPISVTNDANHRTAFDQLIAFCSTINGHPYYFQRESSTDPTHDLPQSATDNGLGRNRMLLNYLSNLTSQSIPGFGGNFLAKYPGAGGISDRDQILTEIFDYVRCANLQDAAKKTATDPFVQFAPPAGNGSNSGAGEVVPIEDVMTSTRGFGRFPTIAKAFLLFIGTDPPKPKPGDPAPPAGAYISAGFFFEMFDPSLGMVPGFPRLRIRVTGLSDFKWGATDATAASMSFTNGTLDTPWSSAFNMENFVGGRIGWPVLSYQKGGKYPFLTTTPLNISDTTSHTFAFQGGDVTAEILNIDGTVLQTVKLNFPNGQFPLPSLVPSSVSGFDFHNLGNRLNATPSETSYSGASWIVENDVVRSVEANPGDLRLIAARKTINPADGLFSTHAYYSNAVEPKAHSLRTSQGNAFNGATGGKLANVSYFNYPSSAEYTKNGARDKNGNYPMNLDYAKDFGNPSTTGVAVGKAAAWTTADVPGDWDNGFGNQADGPFINKVDEGDSGKYSSGGTTSPYYGDLRYTRIAASLYSPNRQMPSAVMFGSLPSGVWANRPWQTLLFRPGPVGHPGLGAPVRTPAGPPYTTPPDHLLLDLFHMPVVEPYAISEPLSTAGRINMNYQILPFTYINRDTGLRAILKAEKVIAVGDSDARFYKNYEGTITTTNYRLDIDPLETLKGFQQRFAAKDIFRSATEICDIHLVPTGATYSSMATYWNTRKTTGDNSRERPYATIYPRLTTKSNTFTIYYRAESLKKRSGSNPNLWEEGKDKVTGEYRGSQTIERFIDPNDKDIPDYASASGGNRPISDFYKIRVLQAKQFAP